MTNPTPEQIQQARELAQLLVNASSSRGTLARAVLALTEQQPEPVSRDKLAGALRLLGIRATGEVADELLSRYTITRKPTAEPNNGNPICECGEPVARWGQPCAACRIPADPEDAAELARGGYQPDGEEQAR